MRSKWKNVCISFKSLNTVVNLVNNNIKQFLKFDSRKLKLFAALLGKKLSIYNGRKRIVVFVRNGMLGKYLGLFIITKRFSHDIHNKNKKK